MAILEDEQKQQLKELFQGLEQGVTMDIFTSEKHCEHCKMTIDLITEIGGLSEKIEVNKYDLEADAEKAKEMNIDKTPAIAVIGDQDYGIRFFGVPAGYEFTPLIQDIINVSRRDPGLPQEVMEELKKIDGPVHLEVMTMPT